MSFLLISLGLLWQCFYFFERSDILAEDGEYNLANIYQGYACAWGVLMLICMWLTCKYFESITITKGNIIDMWFAAGGLCIVKLLRYPALNVAVRRYAQLLDLIGFLMTMFICWYLGVTLSSPRL